MHVHHCDAQLLDTSQVQMITCRLYTPSKSMLSVYFNPMSCARTSGVQVCVYISKKQ